MNLFELWMDYMFFVHLLLTLAGLIASVYCIYNFKVACDIEQKNRIRGYRPPKKEEREEQEQEYEEEPDLPDDDQEEDESQENEGGDSGSYEYDEETEEEEQEEKTETEPETETVEDSSSEYSYRGSDDEEPQQEEPAVEEAYEPAMNATDSGEYENLRTRLAKAEQKIAANSKAFSGILDQYTELEQQIRNISAPSTSGGTDFEQKLEELRKQISETNGKTESDNAASIDNVIQQVGIITEQNANLTTALNDLKQKYEKLMNERENEKIEDNPAIRQIIKKQQEAFDKVAKTEARLAGIEELLQEKKAGRNYTLQAIAEITGNIDNLNKDEIRQMLQKLAKDLSESYPQDEMDGEEEED